MRKSYALTEDEKNRLYRLRPEPGEAFNFWAEVAKDRGVDPKSILSEAIGYFTALPLGHKKWWCYPAPLRCKYHPTP